MLVICTAPMLVLGLVFLIVGKMPLWGKREIRGGYARLAGFIMMLPQALDLLMVSLGAVGRGRGGAQEANAWLIMDILLVGGAVVAVLSIAVLMPHTIRQEAAPTPFVLSSDHVTVADAARYLRISERDLMYFVGKGDIESHLKGTVYYIDKASLIAFVKN